MKKFLKYSLISIVPLFGLSLVSCSSSSDTESQGNHTIHIVNVEDYIYEYDPSSGYYDADLTEQFVAYAEEVTGWTDINVVYDTTDTPETMYNELKTGKSQIDLCCPSDYMIQKMLAEGLLHEIDRSQVPNYTTYCSPTISEYLDSIEAVNSDGETLYVGDYCVGYMWGTLGILFNPNYSDLQDNGLTEEQVIDDMQSFNALWDENYDGTISIKDSIRDTLSVAVMKEYDEDLTSYREEYLNGEITSDEYHEKVNNIFNILSDVDRCTEEVIDNIYDELLDLKSNIFGLEVDSGKSDIVTGKIGVNLAWSGDAVYSISLAADPEETGGNPITLYYSVPENGSNIWFDGWVMPENSNRTEDQETLALLFLDYISDPSIAAVNMDYTGYTSFVGGDSILELVRDWYDIRTEEVYQYVEEDDEYYDVYIDSNTNGVIDEYDFAVSYDDFLEDSHDASLDSSNLYYVIYDEEENIDEYYPVYLLDENDEETSTIKTYGDLTIVDSADSELQEVDLSYFFSGTLVEYTSESDMLFYTDEYYVAEDNVSVGGAFYTQYPDEETVIRCCIMQDFGDNNARMLELWEEFKSGELPTWAVVVLIIEVIAIVGIAIYHFGSKKISKALRQQRKAEKQAQN